MKDRRVGCSAVCMALVLCLGIGRQTQAESPHVFGIHFWDVGANIDVMAHRSGWLMQANMGSDTPSTSQLRKAVGEGFTIIQRLDWNEDHTVPIDPAEQGAFASQCRSWASQIKTYCRYYLIGNEMEISGVSDWEDYKAAFAAARASIRSAQPEARVIIGHFTNFNNLRNTVRALGPNGYDGICDHTGSTVPTDRLDLLDDEGARPEVGVYVTEWGWLIGTNPNAESVINSFCQGIQQSNASRSRQVYAACWFVYPNYSWETFSLKEAGIMGYAEHSGFIAANENCAATNSYTNNRILMSDLVVDVPDNGGSLPVSWTTNVPARRQVWYLRRGDTCNSTALYTNLATTHSVTVSGTAALTEYQLMPSSTANDYGDASGRRFRAKTGYWPSTATQINPLRLAIQWETDWPTDSIVQFGSTPDLGSTVQDASLVTQHRIDLMNLPTGDYYYRVLSSEENPDGYARLYMRSPIRQVSVTASAPGDFDEDDDVDQADFGVLQSCYTGSGSTPTEACDRADFDGDGDVDLNDFGLFQRCFSGAGVEADPFCISGPES